AQPDDAGRDRGRAAALLCGAHARRRAPVSLVGGRARARRAGQALALPGRDRSLWARTEREKLSMSGRDALLPDKVDDRRRKGLGLAFPYKNTIAWPIPAS